MKTPCTSCGKNNWIGIEYRYTSPNHYDGVSEWQCQDCEARFGRWTGKKLEDGEEEPRYGEAVKPKKDAHSKSEFKRLESQGVAVELPEHLEEPKESKPLVCAYHAPHHQVGCMNCESLKHSRQQ